MVVRVYISGISGNKEVKKRQQRVMMILESKSITYNVIDITEPGKENEKEFMQENSKARDSKHPLPPQIFNDNRYCGDYEEFDMANEMDELEKFLNISANDINVVENGISNGSKVEIEKESYKEDTCKSTEEAVTILSNSDIEAVSLGNDVVQSVPTESSPEPVECLNDLNQSSNKWNENPSVPEEIPDKNEKTHDEHESINEEKDENENAVSDDVSSSSTANEE